MTIIHNVRKSLSRNCVTRDTFSLFGQVLTQYPEEEGHKSQCHRNCRMASRRNSERDSRGEKPIQPLAQLRRGTSRGDILNGTNEPELPQPHQPTQKARSRTDTPLSMRPLFAPQSRPQARLQKRCGDTRLHDQDTRRTLIQSATASRTQILAPDPRSASEHGRG